MKMFPNLEAALLLDAEVTVTEEVQSLQCSLSVPRVDGGSWVSVTLQRGCLVGDHGNVAFLIEVSRRLSQHQSRSERDRLGTIMLIAFSFVKLIIHTLSRQ